MEPKIEKDIKLHELLSVIQELLNLTNPITNKYAGKDVSFPIEHTFLLILERAEGCLFSLEHLLKSGDLRHDHAMGLIARNLLSDFFLSSYLCKVSASNEVVENELYKLHHGDLRKVDSLVKLYSDNDAISKEDLTSYEKSQTENIAGIIRRVIVERKLKTNFPNTRQIIEQMLKKEGDDAWASEIIRAYPVWIFFSKYEHLGWMSYHLTRNKTVDQLISRLDDVVRMAAIMIGGCFETLNEKEQLDKTLIIITTLAHKYLDGYNVPRRSP